MLKKTIAAVLLGVLAAWYFYPGDTPLPERRAADSTPFADAAIPADAPGTAADTTVRSAAPSAAHDDGTELVLGLRVQKDRNCTVEFRDYVTPEGEMFSAWSCTPHTVPPKSPYAHYDDDTLAALAYAESGAAAALGQRLIGSDPPRAYELLIRATALDGGNTRHLSWLAEQGFGALMVDRQPHMENLSRQYELAALAVRLGDEPLKRQYLREQLLRFGADERDIARLERRAGELLLSIEDIQRTVRGEITTGGRGDV